MMYLYVSSIGVSPFGHTGSFVLFQMASRVMGFPIELGYSFRSQESFLSIIAPFLVFKI